MMIIFLLAIDKRGHSTRRHRLFAVSVESMIDNRNEEKIDYIEQKTSTQFSQG